MKWLSIVPLIAFLLPLSQEETRSPDEKKSQTEEIVEALEIDWCILIYRHPYQVAASHVRGAKSGLIGLRDKAHRENWLKHHHGHPYVQSQGLSPEDVMDLKYAGFHGLAWRVHAEDTLAYRARCPRTTLLKYSELEADPVPVSKSMFNDMGMEATDEVLQFIQASTTGDSGVLKDGSNEYYSVYRARGSNSLEDSKAVLDSEDVEQIDRFLEGVSPELGIAPA